MRDMVAADLRSAFGGESQAHMRYVIYAQKAKDEGFDNISRLFTAIADAERIHSTNHFSTMADVGGAFLVASIAGFGLGSTSENLDVAIEGETFEINEMYPAYRAVAKAQGEDEAEKSFKWAYMAEKTHAVFFKKAKKASEKGKDVELGVMWICQTCGHTVEGEPPDQCPVCQEPKEVFNSFE
ncbi:Rubrerythrin-2 [Candidatus Poribacteria bacterium]|nr:Rubrerythrin-2 [Candidatus Poribacteria bacterium]